MLNPYEVIAKCAEVGSTTDKVNILKENDTALLRKSLLYGLDPYKVYGIRKYEFRSAREHEDTSYEAVFGLLDLLMKRVYTGDAAKEKINILSGNLTHGQQKVFAWILAKDFRAGIAEGLVNKAFPKLIPEFEVQLAQPEKFLSKVKYPCMVQPKLDGVRTIALVNAEEQSVIYYSRNGKEFKNFTCFDKELIRLCNGSSKMFDGEVVGPPGSDFIGIMQQCRRKYDVEPKGLNFYVFDWMPLSMFSNTYCTMEQQDRTDYLYELDGLGYEKPRVKIVDSVKCMNIEEVERTYSQFVARGYEGIIIKDIHGEYDFKRSNAWIKMKPDTTEDLKVVDIQEGTGKYVGMLGALIVTREDVTINVGSGFKDNERLSLEAARALFIGKTVEVKYDSVTPDGSLRFPRFIKLREDK